MSAEAVRKLVIRSFGLGVYSFHSEGGEQPTEEEVLEWCHGNGFRDPEAFEGSGKTYVVCQFGQHPCGAELDQMREDVDALRAATALSERARERVDALVAAALT